MIDFSTDYELNKDLYPEFCSRYPYLASEGELLFLSLFFITKVDLRTPIFLH